jgi:Lar family restriction alleviation protein
MPLPEPPVFLKPCPFCGCDRILVKHHEPTPSERDYEVKIICDNCKVKMEFKSARFDGMEKIAFKRWNQRKG